MAVQNVNKGFVYITDFTASLNLYGKHSNSFSPPLLPKSLSYRYFNKCTNNTILLVGISL